MSATHDGLDPTTVAVVAGRGDRQPGSPVNVGVELASLYHGSEVGSGLPGYQRGDGNATWAALEEVVGALEGGAAVAFASGMAAVAAVLDRLPAGAAVVAPAHAYQGTRTLVDDAVAAGRLTARMVDITDTDATLAACDGAALLWLESPTNPLLGIAPLAALAEGAHLRGCEVAVDNTFATPLLQSPLRLGADVVVHSLTKLLSGHSDLLLGAVVVGPDDAGRLAALRHQRTVRGGTPGPFEAFLALRGIRTLPVRLDRAQATAAELAVRLEAHPGVAVVRYPGLSTHAGHGLACRQMRGPGQMVAFEVAGGVAAADRVCTGLRVVTHGTSVGGVESLIERRGRYPAEAHLPPGLLRLSVGLEHVEDLWADLTQALAAAGG